jgi:antirestriction protein
MRNTISNSDDIIDSRDVIERIEELEGEESLPEDDAEELAMLRELATEASNYAEDWQYGSTLVRKDYFVTYAEQLADDIGAINANATWLNNHIDWEAAAHELAQDYTEVEFGDVTYLIR